MVNFTELDEIEFDEDKDAESEVFIELDEIEFDEDKDA